MYSFSPEASDKLFAEIKARLASELDPGQSLDESKIFKPFVIILANRHPVYVGQAQWREFRIHPKPRRDCKEDVYLIFSHPRIDEVLDDIQDCLVAGTVAAAIAAILSAIGTAGGSTAAVSLAAFKGVFYACMYTKGIGWASEIGIDLEARNKSCGKWF